MIEATKMAGVDRYTYLGDPAITDSPCRRILIERIRRHTLAAS